MSNRANGKAWLNYKGTITGKSCFIPPPTPRPEPLNWRDVKQGRKTMLRGFVRSNKMLMTVCVNNNVWNRLVYQNHLYFQHTTPPISKLLSASSHFLGMRTNSWTRALEKDRKIFYRCFLFFLLEELIVLLVQADRVLAPELLRLVHRAPFQAARLQLRAVFIKRAGRWKNGENRKRGSSNE